MRATNCCVNSSAIGSCDDEPFRGDARLSVVDRARVTAVFTAASRSALGMTMNGSLPPSSSTVFLIARPAAAATLLPAPSLPVSVAAATRSSAMMLVDGVGADEQSLKHTVRRAGS